MDRTERLLDLVALLLDSREPVSWAEIREHFPDDYGKGSDEATERKFERDKAELLELGIPITWVQGDDERKDGYVVDREAYYLPEVGLTPDELAVLYAAGSAALASGVFPGRQDLAHALRKIGFYAGSEVATPRVRMELGAVSTSSASELAAKLEELWRATAAKKWVEISYYSPHGNETTTRKVEPYGLALRRGIWSMVGYCHLRREIRTFQVHRIRALAVNKSKPRSADFELPAEFKLEDYVASHPWQHRFHAPVEVQLELRGELAGMGPRLFPGSREEEGRTVLSATFLDGLVRHALSLGPDCRVVGPEQAVARHREMATRVLERHHAPVGAENDDANARASGSGS